MKKSGFGRRMLAMLLVLISVLQIIPTGVFAAIGDLSEANTGVDTNTINVGDTINWPIKIYDYLSDGMLFEWNDAGQGAKVTWGEGSSNLEGAPYAGGANPVKTEIGTDFTWSGQSAQDCQAYIGWTGYGYELAKHTGYEAFEKPNYLLLRGNKTGETYIRVASFDSDKTVDDVRYMVVVYSGYGISDLGVNIRLNRNRNTQDHNYYGKWYSDAINANNPFKDAINCWKYAVIDLKSTGDSSTAGISVDEENSDRKGYYTTAWLSFYQTSSVVDLEGYTGFPSGKGIDLSHVAFFSDKNEAVNYGECAVEFDENPGEKLDEATSVTVNNKTYNFTSSRGWTGGNNKNFGLLRASGNDYRGANGGGSGLGYATWPIGYAVVSDMPGRDVWNASRHDPLSYVKNGSWTNYGDAENGGNQIYHIYTYSSSTRDNGYNLSGLNLDGTQLYEQVGGGAIMTAGLMESKLQTIKVGDTEYRVPLYRQETVEYIAYTLRESLRIGKIDSSGNYNMDYISGTASPLYAMDLNGDGDMEDYYDVDGDPRNGNEVYEGSMDLATALRACLGIKLQFAVRHGNECTMGTYEDTMKKADKLYGSFQDCKAYINTAVDAAYYLLNNIFIANSYNQEQDEYAYLKLDSAKVNQGKNDGKMAYVFDAGFTTGASVSNASSALVYSPFTNGGNGTISVENVTGKVQFEFDGSGSKTNIAPFNPVTDAEGEFGAGTSSYYWWGDQLREYATNCDSYFSGANKRENFNYVLSSSGEFIYNEEDDLFFQFEGDDDVYMYINGQLVLDIGGCHSITSGTININDYVERARGLMKDLIPEGYTRDMSDEEYEEMICRVFESDPYGWTANIYRNFRALDLEDGQICKFDFYYMERHGWGANMRVVTNMHITDPSLNVEKKAYQYGDEVEYNGVIDASASVEYNFTLHNTGNMKLYNLTFDDSVIGVSLTSDNGLVVDAAKNGRYVLDSGGGLLEAKDLTAIVKGKNDSGQMTEVKVTFPEVDGDGGQAALKAFLKSLSADGTESGYDDAEYTHRGSGLWVDATVIIKGINYMLTVEQVKAGTMKNTVYVTATTKLDPNTDGNVALRSDAEHRLYTNGFPVHYQWAGHSIFMRTENVLKESKIEAQRAGSQVSNYANFFLNHELNQITTATCDKYGRLTANDYVKANTINGKQGFLINYPEAGIYTFYLLMCDSSYANKNASVIPEGEYAILRSQVYVADVEDSVYVLDYGLSTDSLDADGELFKNDSLFGAYGTLQAKLMGVSNSEPSFLEPTSSTKTEDYSRIVFEKYDLSKSNTVTASDGLFKVNLSVPEEGKNIAYNATTGQYTLTGAGTVSIKAEVPSEWTTPYVYYWYNDGTAGPAFPGVPMTKDGLGYKADILADVPNIIINNGSGAVGSKTEDIAITPGVETTIKVTLDGTKVSYDIDTALESVTLHALGRDIETLYVRYLTSSETGEWTKLEGDLDENGYYSLSIPGNVIKLAFSLNGSDTILEQAVTAGRELWVDVMSNEEGGYNIDVSYSISEGYIVHASVPDNWGDDIYLYYWIDGEPNPIEWPGVKLTKGNFGWFTTTEKIPAGCNRLIVSNGKDVEDSAWKQTADLTVIPGMETWVMVNDEKDSKNKFTAKVAYGSEASAAGFTFTPNKFMDEASSIYLAITVHSIEENPSAISGAQVSSDKALIDIHHEVQMYKKVTVLPANVVYYEDSFSAIEYNHSGKNTFEYFGSGTGKLSQSVDQEQEYGQDEAYQDGSNTGFSGDSLTSVKINAFEAAATFTFKGTGFELVGQTNAADSGIVVAKLYNAEDYTKNGDKATVIRNIPVITQFDHNNDGGDEGIYQVPVIRATDLELGEYTVVLSGVPTYSGGKVKDTFLYIDGVRIYQPLGATNAAYIAMENGASFYNLRELIATGKVAVATLNGGLSVSTGTTTWTENLLGDKLDSGDLSTYISAKVDSTDDYLISGPNNEVYMDGTTSNSALAFYVKQTSGDTHALQIAVRALDYGKFYGAGNTALNVQLQYGVKTDSGYAWKNLTKLVSGTEQYYAIPYAECPVDDNGIYQVVIRAVNAEKGVPAMVSYSDVKLNGLSIESVEGVGESSILYYLNGLLVEPTYYLYGTINGTTYNADTGIEKLIAFENGQLVVDVQDATTITIRRDMGIDPTLTQNTTVYGGSAELGDAYYAELTAGGSYGFQLPAGKWLLYVSQTGNGSLSITRTLYCEHEWDEGKITKEPTCVANGEKTYTCIHGCGTAKVESVGATGIHEYEDGKCKWCGKDEPVITIYYYNSNNWAAPYAYGFDANGNNGGKNWPGVEMTPVAGVDGLYSCKLDDSLTTVIFSDNGNNQTGDQTIPADGRNTFFHDKWYNYAGDWDYYLIGYFDGKDYGNGNDAANKGDYKFVDGKVEISFTETSYVGVKRGDNGQRFWTNSDSTLHNPCTFWPDGNSEKMTVPAGKWTITLTENSDGSISLSYASACEHTFGDWVTGKEATCGADGSKYRTCTACGYKETQSIAATGEHNYENGSCTVCGKQDPSVVEKVTLYLKPNIWTADSARFAAYFFGGSDGDLWLDCVYDSDGIYAVEVPDGYTGVIFCRMNPGTSSNGWQSKWNQTVDLTIPTDGNTMYEITGWGENGKSVGQWTTASTTEEQSISGQQIAVASVARVAEPVAASAEAMNLETLRQQMASTTVLDDGEMDSNAPGFGGNTQKPEQPETSAPAIKPIGASLAFKDEILYNVYFQISNPDNVAIADMGLITWTSQVDGNISNAEFVLSGAVLEGENYKARSQAIAAKKMGEELYFKIYLELADGSYVYSDLLNYSAKTYATNQLNSQKSSDGLKALCVALMNYGASAQTFFDYKTDDLMNADLTNAQQALAAGFSADMIQALVKADSGKTAELTANGGFSSKYPNVTFGGAFSINYIFTPTNSVDGEMKLYVWTAEDYANAEALTLDNASQVLTMNGNASGVYTASVSGISARNVGDTVYVCGVYECDGVTYRTGVLTYSVGAYCASMASRTGNVQALAKATAVYTYYAKQYLG